MACPRSVSEVSVNEIIEKYDARLIQEAADRVMATIEIRKKLSDSRWSQTPLIFDDTTFLLPAMEGYRPLAVTLRRRGLWIEPIYVLHHSGKPEMGFALHIDETEDGLRIYIEDAFDITVTGSHEMGFTLETRLKDGTTIQHKEET